MIDMFLKHNCKCSSWSYHKYYQRKFWFSRRNLHIIIKKQWNLLKKKYDVVDNNDGDGGWSANNDDDNDLVLLHK